MSNNTALIMFCFCFNCFYSFMIQNQGAQTLPMRRANATYPSPHPVAYNLLCSCDEPLPPTNSIQAARLESDGFRSRNILYPRSRSCRIHDSPPSSSPRTACPSQLIFSHHIYDNELKDKRCDIQLDVNNKMNRNINTFTTSLTLLLMTNNNPPHTLVSPSPSALDYTT